tara:strand:+ start:2794 stop:3213 length:420 start_codon:yes stop_codon:yes gene_type:complete
MTREDRLNEIRDYVEYLDQLVGEIEREIGKVPLTVVGFSQGVATATRWAIGGSRAPSRLILWGDFSPPDIDLKLARQRLESAELVMVRGTEDRALSPMLKQQEEERLREAGIDYRIISYSGGHDIDEQTLLTLATIESS